MNASVVFPALAVLSAGIAIALLAIPLFAGIGAACTGACVYGALVS